jgi:hypothetical protein
VTPPLRLRIMRAMRSEVDSWSNGYFQAGSHISEALADGRLPVRLVDEFPRGTYPTDRCRDIAHRSGLLFHDDPQELGAFGPWNVTEEHVSLIVELLHDVTAGVVSIEHLGFGFHEETLTYHGLLLDDVRGHMTGLSLLAAARLLHEAYQIPLHEA